MKHATSDTLDQLEELLNELGELAYLTEKKRGIFYIKSRAFLHFHEDPGGLFADVRFNAEFERFPVNTKTERRLLLDKIATTCA